MWWRLTYIMLVATVVGACTPDALQYSRARPPVQPQAQVPMPMPERPQPPASPLANRAYIPTIPQRQTPVNVAVLLPLSGKHAALGQQLAAVAELAMFETKSPWLRLNFYDTGGEPSGAAAAAAQAARENMDILIGPLLSPEVQAVLATRGSQPILAFSNDRAVAQQGALILGIVPEGQTRRMVDFAISRGVARLAVVVPENAYGETVARAAQATALARQSSAPVIIAYPAGERDGRRVAERLAQQAIDIDGILFAESGARVESIIEQAKLAGVDFSRLQLLGLQLWQDYRTNPPPALWGGWYAAPAVERFAMLESRLRSGYGMETPRVAALVYDAVALLAALAPSVGLPEFSTRLRDPAGFTGIDGVFRFNPDGTTERGLAVFELTGSGARVLSPAPRTFRAANASAAVP